jgi:hypothetical protein
MKVTSSKLKKIITEELNVLISESEDYNHLDKWSEQLEITIDAIQHLAAALKDADPKSTEYVGDVLHRRVNEYINENYIKRNQ